MSSKVKEILKTLCWPILFGIGQFFICGFFIFLYMIMHPEVDWSSSKSNTILLDYLNQQTIWVVLIECLLFIPLFYMRYKKYHLSKQLYPNKTILYIGLLSFLLSGVLNLMIIIYKHWMHIPMAEEHLTFTIILATGIAGPIIEELLFRGIVYGRFMTILSEKKAFYLATLVFALSHTGGISQIFFAMIIGYYLTHVYAKYQDIRLSMMAHIIVNITSLLLTPYFLALF